MKPHVLAMVIIIPVLVVVMAVSVLGYVALQMYNQLPDQAGLQQIQPGLFERAPGGQPMKKEELVKFRKPEFQNCKLAGPFAHDNLTVFLVQGKDTWKGQELWTLQEALDRGQAEVNETGFGTLTLDNRSNAALFIQSGDIVKGGNQDRTIQYDQIISQGKTRVPLASFCVEQGRCGPRGFESTAHFSASTQQVPGKDLRLAVLYRKAQFEVWNGVRGMQDNLSLAVGGPVKAPESTTSLQLTLENPRLQDSLQAYLDRLGNIAEGKKDVIGFAVVINGQVQSADIYASSSLFRKLWPRALRANAIAAVAKRNGNPRPATVNPNIVEALLKDNPGSLSRFELANGLHLIQSDGPRAVVFETCDQAHQNVVLHRAILVK